ncbi:HalOD1 output domain-containing protein [Halomarina oriensis]|uniref:Halobacterial output domain-containing protein n=1 Tax=Halomarina oriensis TaxID=671145 RepID=A0A6B0GLX1_9EURY|nr:HalOD1 output domain-containing protein [Halomarina oriensis]MWG35724.1 hypothetical protein [Halomarina oriensis]
MSSQSSHSLAENAWQNDGSDLQMRFDPRTESVCETIVVAVAESLGESPLEIPTVHDSIDPDALDSLFALRCPDSGAAPRCRLAFRYAGCLVRVYSSGYVTVDPNERI